MPIFEIGNNTLSFCNQRAITMTNVNYINYPRRYWNDV